MPEQKTGIPLSEIAAIPQAIAEQLIAAGYDTAEKVAGITPETFDLTSLKGVGASTAAKILEACQTAAIVGAKKPTLDQPPPPDNPPAAAAPAAQAKDGMPVKKYFSKIPNLHLMVPMGNWPDGKEKPCKEIQFAGNFYTTKDPFEITSIESAKDFVGNSDSPVIWPELSAPSGLVAGASTQRASMVQGTQTTANARPQMHGSEEGS